MTDPVRRRLVDAPKRLCPSEKPEITRGYALISSPIPGRGLGGQSGDGRQFISWLHDADLVRSVFWLIQKDELSGPVNLAAPNPLPNSDFMRILREAWGVPFGLPASNWMLEVGALLLRSEAELILKSRRVVPTRLLESGFDFGFPTWRGAAKDLCERARAN